MQAYPGTYVGNEDVGVPTPLHRDLREQNTSMPAIVDHETVASDLHRPRIGARLNRTEHRHLDRDRR